MPIDGTAFFACFDSNYFHTETRSWARSIATLQVARTVTLEGSTRNAP